MRIGDDKVRNGSEKVCGDLQRVWVTCAAMGLAGEVWDCFSKGYGRGGAYFEAYFWTQNK